MTHSKQIFRSSLMIAGAVSLLVAACAGSGDGGGSSGGSGGSSSGGSSNNGNKGGSSSSGGSGGSSSNTGGSGPKPSGGSSGTAGASGGAGTGGSGSGTAGTSGGAGTTGTGGTGTTAGLPTSTGGVMTTGGYYMSGGYKGYAYTAADSTAGGTGTSTIAPAEFTMVTPELCVAGTAAAVPDANSYSTYWGVLVGWNLDQAMGTATNPNPATNTVMLPTSGTFTVELSGAKVPTVVRLKVSVGTDDYCTELAPAGANAVKVTDLKKSCWDTKAVAMPYAGQPVKDIAVQVPTTLGTAIPYDFCIKTLTFTP